MSVHDECPDPWRAAREASYLTDNSITDVVDGSRAFNDDESTCLTDALTTSGGEPSSRASRVEVHVDSSTPTAFILVQRDAITDVAGVAFTQGGCETERQVCRDHSNPNPCSNAGPFSSALVSVRHQAGFQRIHATRVCNGFGRRGREV